MDLESLEGHRRILGIIFVVLNALTLLGMLAFAAFAIILGMVGTRHVRADERDMLTVITLGVTGCLSVMALPGLFTGIGLLRRRPWSRALALVLGILAIPNIPLGTALGIYAIWFYTQSGSDQVFE
ncbi:hypothetical protein JY651_08335 [Pyxidicoccus parkwayensis]|uniref:ABC transporter permease n=1 Tax=Pyxidicoccus parkwayensis TaxID=2813578 RepID=A0ABX7PC34_9BACT|nr:hypothetical protein JY651_08335 [Pyxidicoccus parkwaysis]